MSWNTIIYGSTSGNTEKIANKIGKEMNINDILSISDKNAINLIKEREYLIFGTSTWGIGDLQDDWESSLKELKKIDFFGKKVVIFGLGDQNSYSDSFVDGMRELYNIVIVNGGTVLGKTSTNGYDFSQSKAVINNMFIGLVIDEDNQSDLTDKRIIAWIKDISAV